MRCIGEEVQNPTGQSIWACIATVSHNSTWCRWPHFGTHVPKNNINLSLISSNKLIDDGQKGIDPFCAAILIKGLGTFSKCLPIIESSQHLYNWDTTATHHHISEIAFHRLHQGSVKYLLLEYTCSRELGNQSLMVFLSNKPFDLFTPIGKCVSPVWIFHKIETLSSEVYKVLLPLKINEFWS